MGTSKARAEQRQEAKVASKGHMTVSNGVIFSSREPLQRLMAKSLPVRTSFALARLANTLNSHFQTIESVRNGLIKKYGRPVEGKHDGTMQVAADAEDYLVFIAEMNELFAVEVDVAAQKVMLPAALSGLEIEPAVLIPLLPFVDMEEAQIA